MSATSGIGISSDLSETFANVVDSDDIRFVKVAIQNESLVPNGTIRAVGPTLEEDLGQLQSFLEDSTPAYVLARISGQSSGWLAISYVPDAAKVRDKMLYASSRNSLTKGLGSAHFTDNLFATSKADLTIDAYAAHKAHNAAPKPLSAREREMADIREAERQAGSGGALMGSRARRNHVGTGVGLAWSEEAEGAVKELGQGEGDQLIVMSIDTASETLVLSSSAERNVDEIATNIPSSEPSFALFAWKHNHSSVPRRDIVLIYSCPSDSLIKDRMIYSSSSYSIVRAVKSLLADSSSNLVPRKIETSDPSEITETYLISELGLAGEAGGSGGTPISNLLGGRLGSDEGKAFARPKGPGRKR